VVHTGGNGGEMVACVVWGVEGGLFDIILERGDSNGPLRAAYPASGR
jgi:hypothetical protein